MKSKIQRILLSVLFFLMIPVLALAVYQFTPSRDNLETIGNSSKAWRTVVTYEVKTGLKHNALWVSTAPTISSGFGTSPSIANNNGTGAFTINVGTGGTATSGVISLPQYVAAATQDSQSTQGAANGYACSCADTTTPTAGTCIASGMSCSAGACTMTVGNYKMSTSTGLPVLSAWTASDVVAVTCTAY